MSDHADNSHLKMTVTMDVTPAQALALREFFTRWNQYASMGCSRYVAFYVDGDGNFHPNCQFDFSVDLPTLSKDELKRCEREENKFDYDPIAWALHKEPKK